MLAAVYDSETAVFQPHLARCSECGIIIFRSEAQAKGAGMPFYAHINGRIGNKCTGCATGDVFIGLRAEKKIGDVMKKNEGLVLKVETGVGEPGKSRKKGVSKYDPIHEVVDRAKFNEWIRIQVPTIRDASMAKAHFRKLAKDDRLPYVLHTSAISGENGVAWLYAKKEVKADKELDSK